MNNYYHEGYRITNYIIKCHAVNLVTIRHKQILGQVVQSIISLTSLLVVKMLTVLVSTISNSQVFLLKKCE